VEETCTQTRVVWRHSCAQNIFAHGAEFYKMQSCLQSRIVYSIELYIVSTIYTQQGCVHNRTVRRTELYTLQKCSQSRAIHSTEKNSTVVLLYIMFIYSMLY
jgi:hypothetical protein